MAFLNVKHGSSMRVGSRKLVLYISVSPNDHSTHDGRQRIYEGLNVANSFPQFELRTVRVDGNAIFDDIMTILLTRLTEEDFCRLQMIIVNGYAQNLTGTLGGDSFTGAFFKVILLALLHRFPSVFNNNSDVTKIAVVCAQCFSHVFVQQAESVPATNPVYKFIALTDSYMPYLIHTENVPKIDWISWDVQTFLQKLLVAPKLTCTSPTSPNSPSITLMR